MGYASITDVTYILAQALTGARPETPGTQINLINVGTERDLNVISDDLVEFYIQSANNKIDGILSQMYYTPLVKCAQGQWDLDAAINEYNQTVEISDATNLVEGDEMVIRDDSTGDEEFHIISSVIDQYSFDVVSPIATEFEGDDVRVIRIGFPPTIRQICARYAASFVYDKYFAAQASPNISDYGTAMRNDAIGDLNDILNGRIILQCQRRRGDRHGNPWLDDSYQLRDRGFDGQGRDKSQPK